MFSLITVVFAVVLVIAVVIAAAYFGGDAFTGGQAQAKSAEITNQYQQIHGAVLTYSAQTGGLPTGTSDDIKSTLVTGKYMASIPKGWTFQSGYLTYEDGVPDEICLAHNEKLGVSTIPACSSPEADVDGICCN